MGRRRCGKFVPDRDRDFAFTAKVFANGVARDPGLFMLSADDAGDVTRAVDRFRAALAEATHKRTRTAITIMRKDQARREAERVVRRCANLIRANEAISAIDKMRVGVKERPTRLRRRACPGTRPVLVFVGTTGGPNAADGAGAKHVLRYAEKLGSGTRAKPAGAARLELAVELVAEHGPTPKTPGQLSGGRVWYLRSFTKNPMEVEFPMPAEPALVVYWGRWADATGEVGPWSQTLVARVEGWPLPAAGPALPRGQRRPAPVQLAAAGEAPQRSLAQAHAELDEHLLPDGRGGFDARRALPDVTTIDTTGAATMTVTVKRGAKRVARALPAP